MVLTGIIDHVVRLIPIILLVLVLLCGSARALNPLDGLTYPVMAGANTMNAIGQRTLNGHDWLLDYIVLNGITLAAIRHQGQIKNGILCCPSLTRYADNVSQIRFYDRDKLSAELIHPAAGFAWWVYLRRRGYPRTEATAMIAGLALTREWVFKAWGAPPSVDDPLIFTAGGVLLGTAAETLLGLDFANVTDDRLDVYPLFQWDRHRREVLFGLTVPF